MTEHERLLLPYDPPLAPTHGGRLPAIPELWRRAQHLFTRVIDHIGGSTAGLAHRRRIMRKDRSILLGWLEPVEKLARACLLARAFAFLMLTPEGRKLVRETPKIPMPEAKRGRPGDRTPAPAERTPHERDPDESFVADRYDPQTWKREFRILRWHLPDSDDRHEAHKPESTPEPARLDPLQSSGAATDSRAPLRLARRIEALSRVLANPDPAIQKLARFLATLPRAAVEPLGDQPIVGGRNWRQALSGEHRQAGGHVRRAVAMFCLPDPEPG